MADNEHGEIFLLYNEREEAVDYVVEQLKSNGVSVYFFRRDIRFGGKVAEIEEKRLIDAPVVLTLLGERGWGKTQKHLAEQAVRQKKYIVPAIIGEAPDVALSDVGGLFRDHRWVDLRQGAKAYAELSSSLLSTLNNLSTEGRVETRSGASLQIAPQVDEVFKVIVRGSDLDRGVLLESLNQVNISNRRELVERLRHSIQYDYSPKNEARLVAENQDTFNFASIRGWMLSVLILLEPNEESEKLILMHVDESREPNRDVRFWTLAEIIQIDVSYLRAALARAAKDTAGEVATLALLAESPANSNLIASLRQSLHSDDYDAAWYVLRVLRVYPVPALALDVVEQLHRSISGKSLAYDALYALASPNMAFAAKDALVDRIGERTIAKIVFAESVESKPSARKAFGQLLSIFDYATVRDGLFDAAGDMHVEVASEIIRSIQQTQKNETPSVPRIAGYASDTIDISEDDIDIKQDVETLASVMLSREVKPPLAIGLFGEWGAGKSFFMKSIASKVTSIAEGAAARPDNQFCSNVVQIHFNAWHYVDTNLWANLMSHLLDGIAKHVSPSADPKEAHAELTRELDSVRIELDSANEEREQAISQLARASQTLQERILERERKELKLHDFRAKDLVNLFDNDKILKSEVVGALRRSGAPEVVETLAELNRIVVDSYSVGGRAASLFRSIFSTQSAFMTIAGIVLVIYAPSLVAWIQRSVPLDITAEISTLTARMVLGAGAAFAIVRNALSQASKAIGLLADAKSKVDKCLAYRRGELNTGEQQLEDELVKAKAAEQTAAERVSAVSDRAKDLEKRVTAIEQERSLGYFATERSISDDYRRHLGLISVVRKDFEGLVERLTAGDSQDGKHIDRIVLYIDDVDRCPPNIVVDILQAVHLLLAYELFVVVVSVDARWLMHSLEAKFVHLKKDESIGNDFATPQDYLDKIFQVPFSVRPMNHPAFERMMRRLLAPTVAAKVDASLNFAPSDEVKGKGESAALGGVASRTSENGRVARLESRSGSDEYAPAQPYLLDALARAISISEAETAFAARLHELLSTPRSAKRFSNIYRLLKATISVPNLSVFEGTTVVPGRFQLPMLLLAALTGDPSSALTLFPQFQQKAERGVDEWWVMEQGDGHSENENVARMRRHIGLIVKNAIFLHDSRLVLEWLPQVSRYSFLTARLFFDRS